MTVIAGVSLFNGVMLLADCRITVQRSGHPDVYADICQKIFPLTESMAIGFSGDLSTAAFILKDLRAQLAKRDRKNIGSILQWIPRFLKARYREHGKNQIVHFMVGAVRRNKPNSVERQKVVELMKTIAFGTPSIQRSFIPDVVMRVLMTPPTATHVTILGAVQGVLCTMSSPNFQPRYYSPLEYCAIGSGQSATHEVARTADWILAGQPGNDMIESMGLRDAVSQFVASNDIAGVGGMYPCVKIDGRGIGCLGITQKMPLYELLLRFDNSSDRWIQTNKTTGKTIELLYPWEIEARTITTDKRFDDWWDAVVNFNPLRGQHP